MAFKFVKALSGENYTTIESRPTKPGTAIAADGALTLVGGVVEPTMGKPCFIAAGATQSSAAPSDTAVYPVLPQHIYETTFCVDAAAVQVGDKVTLTPDGLQVTATTEGGVATIWQMLGTKAGAAVQVRFENSN